MIKINKNEFKNNILETRDSADYEMIGIWLDELITDDRILISKLKDEIEQVESAISNEKMWALADDTGMHANNIITLKAYLEILNDILNK